MIVDQKFGKLHTQWVEKDWDEMAIDYIAFTPHACLSTISVCVDRCTQININGQPLLSQRNSKPKRWPDSNLLNFQRQDQDYSYHKCHLFSSVQLLSFICNFLWRVIQPFHKAPMYLKNTIILDCQTFNCYIPLHRQAVEKLRMSAITGESCWVLSGAHCVKFLSSLKSPYA